MAFELPTLTKVRALMIAAGQAVFPDRNWGNAKSYHARRATFISAAVTQIIASLRDLLLDLFPTTARDGGGIQRWGKLFGVEQNAASPARKSAALRVRGTAGTLVPTDTELVHTSALRFKVATGATIPGGAEYVDVDVVAIDTGAQTRLTAGQTLSIVGGVPGLETDAVLVKDLDENGFDQESFGAYRARVLAAIGLPSAGGNDADYIRWGLEVDGIANAYSYANRAGLGTQDVVGLKAGSGAARVLSPGELAAYVAYIASKAPNQVSAPGGSLRGLLVATDPKAVEIVITPNGDPAYAFDFTGGPLTVLAWTAGTLTLQFTTPLPASLKAGHSICLKPVASAQDGRPYRIAAIAGADSVILESAPVVAPVATDVAYSSGPLVQPIRDAIKAHLDGETVYAGKNRTPQPQSALASTVGLEVLAIGMGPANPNGKYGEHVGGIYRQILTQIALFKQGVRNANVVDPPADVEAIDFEFPLDASIDLIVPSSVLVRGAT